MVDRADSNTTAQDTSLPTTNPNGKAKKKPAKPQSNLTDITSTPPPRKNRTPQPNQLLASLSTPMKLNKPPTQAYAGPTFHASPAASALPIPKLLSRSVPNLGKTQSLKTMMKDDTSSGSSNKSDDSPTLRNALQVQDSQVHEASPLDVFFNAHRQEKARAQMSTPAKASNGTIEPGQCPDVLANTSHSVSPVPDYVRHHSRHATGGSNAGMFPLEMDASESHRESGAPHNQPTNPGTESSPSVTVQKLTAEEQARAKTIALKKLLLSPQPQRPSSASALTSNIPNNISSPFASPSSRPAGPPRSISSSSTPIQNSHTPPYLLRSLDHKSSTPYLHHSASTGDRLSAQSRPLSSQLRQEIMPNTPTTPKELPSTPTPSRSYNIFQSHPGQNNNSVKRNGHHPSFTKFSPEDALKAATGHGSEHSVAVMEDELRKILKLDLLGSGGAAGVRS